MLVPLAHKCLLLYALQRIFKYGIQGWNRWRWERRQDLGEGHREEASRSIWRKGHSQVHRPSESGKYDGAQRPRRCKSERCRDSGRAR